MGTQNRVIVTLTFETDSPSSKVALETGQLVVHGQAEKVVGLSWDTYQVEEEDVEVDD